MRWRSHRGRSAALEQLLAPFDNEDAAGALPNSVTHSEVLHNYVKPPMCGWARRRPRAIAGPALTRPEVEAIHDRISLWLRFWLDYRRRPSPELLYSRHGNDSGWGDSTAFGRHQVIDRV